MQRWSDMCCQSGQLDRCTAADSNQILCEKHHPWLIFQSSSLLLSVPLVFATSFSSARSPNHISASQHSHMLAAASHPSRAHTHTHAHNLFPATEVHVLQIQKDRTDCGKHWMLCSIWVKSSSSSSLGTGQTVSQCITSCVDWCLCGRRHVAFSAAFPKLYLEQKEKLGNIYFKCSLNVAFHYKWLWMVYTQCTQIMCEEFLFLW